MKKTAAFLAAAVLFSALTACLARGGGTEDGLLLWFAAPQLQQTAQVSSALDTCAYTGEESVPALLSALLAGPGEDSGLTSLIPAGVELEGWAINGRVAEVTLSAPYAELSGIDRTLADYCITLTLTQLAGVDGVRIFSAGGWEGWRVYRAGDVIFSGAEEEPVDVPATLYFRRAGGDALGTELRVFRLTEDEAPAKAVLEALIAGPEDEGLAGLLPQDAAVLSAGVDDGVCYANFTEALLEQVPEGGWEQALVISSIVETLCSLDKVEQVQLLVEGRLLESYGGMDVTGPLLPESARLEQVQGEENEKNP